MSFLWTRSDERMKNLKLMLNSKDETKHISYITSVLLTLRQFYHALIYSKAGLFSEAKFFVIIFTYLG